MTESHANSLSALENLAQEPQSAQYVVMRLSDRQQGFYSAILAKSQKLSRMYLGALAVLSQKENE